MYIADPKGQSLMIKQQRIERFIQILEAKNILTGRLNTEGTHIEIFRRSDPERIIARRATSDFEDTNVDLITLLPAP